MNDVSSDDDVVEEMGRETGEVYELDTDSD